MTARKNDITTIDHTQNMNKYTNRYKNIFERQGKREARQSNFGGGQQSEGRAGTLLVKTPNKFVGSCQISVPVALAKKA